MYVNVIIIISPIVIVIVISMIIIIIVICMMIMRTSLVVGSIPRGRPAGQRPAGLMICYYHELLIIVCYTITAGWIIS